MFRLKLTVGTAVITVPSSKNKLSIFHRFDYKDFLDILVFTGLTDLNNSSEVAPDPWGSAEISLKSIRDA